MATLCIDTATDSGMVVVVRPDQSMAAVRWRSKAGHAENLLGHIESAMEELGVARDDLALIGANVGPGGFTSLRVGLATAKGLALGLGLPIVGVSALRILARSIENDTASARVPIMNAYRGDVFAAAYSAGDEQLEERVAPSFGPPSDVLGHIRDVVGDQPIAFGGGGVASHADVIEAVFGAPVTEDALRLDAASPSALAAEVKRVFDRYGPGDLARLEPTYLRPSDAKLPKDPLRPPPSS